MFNKQKVAIVALATLIASFTLGLSSVFASAGVTATATTNVSSDTAVSGFTNLPAITITEGAAGDIATGTLSFLLPSGFAFDTTASSTVSFSGTGLAGSLTVNYPDNTHANVSITSTSSSAGTLTIGSGTALRVKATNGTPLASGNITLSSGTITGINNTTNFGTLTQVPGTPAKLAFGTQPISSVATGTVFTAGVLVQDQFGNTVTTDNGRSVMLQAVVAGNTSVLASSTLGGTTAVNDNAGISNFTNLTYPTLGSIQLNATSSALANVFSTIVNVVAPSSTPTPTSTPPSFLRNGMLVIVIGNPTVYMYVNGSLRPFTTPAIFHARGKKFTDIVVITQAQFATLTVGKPVGQSDDDNIPTPSSTSTPPSLSSLPDGSIVKVPGNPTIYIVSGGVLQPFPSLAVFNSHKKSLKDIQTITQDQLNALTVGAPATFPDGTLLKGSDNTVYVVNGGQLFAIPSLSVFNKHGWSFKNVMKVGDNEIQGHPHGGNED